MVATSGRHGGIYFYRIEPHKIQKVFDRNRELNGRVVFFHFMANDDDKLIACGSSYNEIIGNYLLKWHFNAFFNAVFAPICFP